MSRKKINVASLLATLLFLYVAVEIGNGNLAVRITKISENLDRALSEVMSESNPQFTNLTDNATYISEIGFNPYGMAGLYNFTKKFIDLVVPKEIYPEGLIIIKDNTPVLGEYDEWKSLVVKYAGILAMIIILLLLFVFMPFCGVCFCCCRCCGKCGARSQPFDKKHDLCKKITLATLLIGFGTLLLFGVVCAFVSNEQMQKGVDKLTDNLRNNVKDFNTYLDSTNGQMNTLLRQNYQEFQDKLTTTINDSGNIVYEQLLEYSKATSMTELAKMVTQLPDIRNKFDQLKYSTNSLRVYASQLNDAVRKVKKDLLGTLQSCAHPKCVEIQNNISLLQTNIHFNSLPDITTQIGILDDMNQDNLQQAVTSGQKRLDEINTQIGDVVNETLKTALSQVKEAGKQIRQGSDNVTHIIDDLKSQINSNTHQAFNNADDFIKQYGPYRYWAGWGISLVLLLISICITLGLICGICGKRPDVYGDDCCNKGAGSQFLICGVMLMFLTGFIVSILVLAMFLAGSASQRVICDPFADPENSQMFKIIDQIDLTEYYIDFKMSQSLIDCYKNKSLYNVFNLTSKFNISDVENYLTKYNISDTLNNLDTSGINIGAGFQILTDAEEDELEKLASGSQFADINFDLFKEILEDNFTSASLKDLSNELGNLIDVIQQSERDNYGGLVNDLQLSKMNIETYQERIVEPMVKNATDVVNLAITLDNDLKLNYTSFPDAIKALLTEIKDAEKVLQETGVDKLTEIAKDFTNGLVNQIQNYLDRVVTLTQNDVGKCGPLALVINSTLSSTCDKILIPWNGFWFGLFWSLLLFIPTIFVSVKLATLYQKFSPYSGPLVEAEYLYDAYAERDSIPLNSSNPRSGKLKKKKNKKYSDYEDRPIQPSSSDRGRDYTRSALPQEARYADMAPKRWEEFPAGGPPQYQPAPTEYERPPPYYYPAAGQTQ